MTDRVAVGLLQNLFERGKGIKFGAFIITQNDDVAVRVQIVYLQEIGVEFIISRVKNGKGQIVFYGIAVCCAVRAVDSYVEVRIRLRRVCGECDGISCFFEDFFHAVTGHFSDSTFANDIYLLRQFDSLSGFDNFLRSGVYGVCLSMVFTQYRTEYQQSKQGEYVSHR